MLRFLILDIAPITAAEMKYSQPSLRLRVAARNETASTKRRLPEVESTGKTAVQRRRAGYDTAAATGLERNNTVTRPLEHMITESDVPDYAELQRHHGHREKMYSVNALRNPMPCINFMQISCISSRKHIQMISNVLTSCELPLIYVVIL